MTDTRNFRSGFILYKTFSLHSKRGSKAKKNNGTDPEVKNNSLMRKKVKKCCMSCKKLTCGRFTLNGKSVYFNLICRKQIIIKPVQSEYAI